MLDCFPCFETKKGEGLGLVWAKTLETWKRVIFSQKSHMDFELGPLLYSAGLSFSRFHHSADNGCYDA